MRWAPFYGGVAMSHRRHFRHVYAVLVHEAPDCVVDLVRNLRHLDPGSEVLVYSGSQDPFFLSGLGLESYGAVVHPTPRAMRWGYLHDFALDCMRFALADLPFDAMTIVDSDQLALRPGYSAFLEDFLGRHPNAGLLGCADAPQPRHTHQAPAAHAWREQALWQPYLAKFEGGPSKFPWWTFWPSTVFTRPACEALVACFDGDEGLKALLARSSLWATEEVLFPTLVALLGFDVLKNPASYDLVRYRVAYSTHQLAEARRRPDVYWVHPVPRGIDHPLRAFIRRAHGDYDQATRRLTMLEDEPVEILRTLPLLERIRSIEGWLEDDEADLLLATALKAARAPATGAFVEVGSFQGRATVLLGAAVRAESPERKVYAIDPHDGVIGARDGQLRRVGPTRDKFERNIAAAGLSRWVDTVQSRAPDVAWEAPVAFLLVDGLHDYDSAAADLRRFEPHLEIGAYVAFHDCADYFPGVVRLVRELEASGRYVRVARARSLVVFRRIEVSAAAAPARAEPPHVAVAAPTPRVSCIMPTRNRRRFVPESIAAFLAQDFEGEAELIIVDDGDDAISDLVPAHPRVRYLRLDRRRTIGAKRNLACEDSRGEFIVHWDDDDWQSPRRLRVQVEDLERTGADVVGLKNVFYHHPDDGRAYRYEYGAAGRPWVAGCSMAYRRAFWDRDHFPDIDVGEDARFVWAQPGARVHAHLDEQILVARIHAANVSPKRTSDARWRPIPEAEIHAIVGARMQVTAAAGPRVSCVMPTRNRPELVLEAVAQFEAQTISDAELIVVDDGAGDLRERLAGHDRVRYLRAPESSAVGAKRNIGAEAARGRYIAHWDDDDWYAPGRLQAQLDALGGSDAQLCGLRTCAIFDAEQDTLWSISDEVHRRMFVGDVHGRSLLFDAELWRSGVRYPAARLGEDAAFLRDAMARAAKLVRVDRADLFVYVRHRRVTWRFECGTHVDPRGWSPGTAPPGFDEAVRGRLVRALVGRQAS